MVTTTWTLEKIQDANHRAGQRWFDPETMKWWASRIDPRVHQGRGGIYLVSSEASRAQMIPRRYSVRRFDPATGHVETAVFHKLETLRAARAEAERLALSGC